MRGQHLRRRRGRKASRDARRLGHALRLDELGEIGRGGMRTRKDQFGPGEHRRERQAPGVRVKERDGREHAVGLEERRDTWLVQHERSEHERAMRVPNGLRLAGGGAREADRRRQQLVELRELERGSHRRAAARSPAHPDADPRRRASRRPARRVGFVPRRTARRQRKSARGVASAIEPLDRLPPKADIDHLSCRADTSRGEKHLEVAVRVPREARDAVSRAYAQTVESTRKRPDPRAELAIGQRSAALG